ncbi:protein furry isoform X2 [Anthonomus grandis grandis]|uniref:protein furry isoform X2 n=1 Tax=Anthonomus grandis grandis TaxID=2921223 RepID=UPI0021669B77|nr:protein furry isoform X2 [Anthonomus grandis grandis]
MSDHQHEPHGLETDLTSNDSDVECSQSVCSDTHSDNTSVHTDKSTLSESTIHAVVGGSESENVSALPNLPLEKKVPNVSAINRSMLLPWGAQKDRVTQLLLMGQSAEGEVRPGEFVMRSLFQEFTILAEKKIENVMTEPQEKPLSKTLQRGEDLQFDQLLGAFGSVAEHCLPSLLKALFSWYERQMSEVSNPEQKKSDIKQKSIINIVAGNTTETPERSEADIQKEKRDLAVEFIFCLVLIEVLKQLSFHPGHEDLVQYIENLALKHFKHQEGIQNNPNSTNIHMICDLYAEVIGVLAQSRFMSVRTRFMAELKELRSREPSPATTHSIISLLMGMKFFRVKMVPIEEFEASFQFMQECAQYFLEVKDKDIKHALAGLFVEILVPVAAAVKNEVNVPCLKNFVEMLYSQTVDACTKAKHRLALFPLVTCLLCVSQKQFFLQYWHCFLAMCLSHLKNRDPKMCRVALESLYRLLWVYMIRIKCESNSATHSRLQSIVNSLFPKGSKGIVPRDTPLNIFVKIIQFIAQERLDFAMREIVFDLLSVGRPIKMILTPERMSIGLRAFLVVADSLQQKEGDPPMPRSVGVLPSGNTLRVRKTFLNKMLTEDTAKSIGMNAYFPHVRLVFVDILRALDTQCGRPLMMTNTQNVNKEPDEMITGERKPRIELFRTCVAAVPRLIPDGMTSSELVDLLSRLTVHMDEELRGLSYCSLQSLVVDFPEWRQDVLWGLTQFVAKEISDTFPQLMDHGLKMILTLLCAWKSALTNTPLVTGTLRIGKEYSEMKSTTPDPNLTKKTDIGKSEPLSSVLHLVEAFAVVMLCNYRLTSRRLCVLILKEVKSLLKLLGCSENVPVIDVLDQNCASILERCLPLVSPADKAAIQTATNIDFQWLADRNSSTWTMGLIEEGSNKNQIPYTFNVIDPWSVCLFGFLEKDKLLSLCPIMTLHSWPIVYTRLNALFSVVDPTPLTDNRASLLRSATAVKKPQSERDPYMHLWKNYITFAFKVVPLISNPIVRCASPDLSLSSSPDSLSQEKSETKLSASISPSALYKLVIPHLRCEVTDIRDAAVYAAGSINGHALRDLLEELTPYIRDAIDKKQENVRRRRRRDALRLQIMRLLEYIAENETFGVSSCSIDKDSGGLHANLVEFIEGVRYYLENESDKNSTSVRDLTYHFCYFLIKLIKNFSLDIRRSLLKRDLRKSLFSIFNHWVGKYALPNMKNIQPEEDMSNKKHIELQFAALQAMSSLLCCGPCFDSLTEESPYYLWLDTLLNSSDEKMYNLAQETVILLLESNPDVSQLLDWLVDKCYTGSSKVADCCFLALATIFSTREYPCDHYTAIINVTLMNTGCSRQNVRDTALQLLQLLDKRFFGSVGPLQETDLVQGDKGRDTLDAILATSYCRSQIHLSSQLALLHPELTMPMFSEITYRFQTARPEVRQVLLQYLIPWLHNMELVDPNIPPINPHMYHFYTNEMGAERKEGWGSAEATEMVLNNIFYITAKFGDNHPKEIEEIWGTLCTSWPNNMKIIIRYLIIISGMAPCELLPYAKRVVLYLARVQPVRLLDEMMLELQTVETLNCLIERTETPPFYRLTVMRKTSSHSDGTNGVAGQSDCSSRNDLSIEKGTIHTKRHSGEDPSKFVTKSESGGNVFTDFSMNRNDKLRNPMDDLSNSLEEALNGDEITLREKVDIPQPHPLPMPEFGGYFAPLTEYLPDTSQPISGFHRCNVGVILLCDIVVDGIELDWAIHVPLMLHILFLGLDHNRTIVYQHCKQLLMNLLIVLANHNDHLTVAHILLNSQSMQLGLGLTTPVLPIVNHVFTEVDSTFDEFLYNQVALTMTTEPSTKNNLQSISSKEEESPTAEENDSSLPPVIVLPENCEPVMPIKLDLTTPTVIKSLIDFLATRQTPLWNYEDITAKVFTVKSAEQIDIFLQYILKVFKDSLPNSHINERWAQTALQLGLSCSSRHYAGRSLQIFRALRVPITSRMLSDILSRLIETVAEQGEDMQGYVTELLLTLEAAVDSLESDFRPLDLTKEIFKSTPNLNNKDAMSFRKNADGLASNATPILNHSISVGHARSTSYSVSYGFKKCLSGGEEKRNRNSQNDMENRTKFSNNLSRSRSAQSLKMLGDSASQDDKLTILAQLFWLAVSLLESDYEHEFSLAVRLLARVMHRLPLDRPDARDKVEKLQQQLRWNNFPGVHALLLKGCTHPNLYESTIELLSQFTPLLNFLVVDTSQSTAFPMNVIALLPYMLLNYEDANELCIRAAENIAQVSIEKSKKLENLGTVMNLYSRRTFSKESFQWTKCVIKYLHDTYSHLGLTMLSFLVEILEKGPSNLQLPILNIIHCVLHYVDLATPSAQPINADLLRIIIKYIEGPHWKESLKILKLVVSRSSSLVAPPISLTSHWESHFTSIPHPPTFTEDSVFSKKELPGRTMEFTFDLSQTPVIGRRFLHKIDDAEKMKTSVTPRRSCSISPADVSSQSGWKRPWLCQGRVRECLVNLLTTCGQRVGLPKSPSVIFSQTSDLIERQSSMASSTEEVSAGNNDMSGGSRRDDAATEFGVFKDFDFLEYESESIEGESTDNFNWGVRRHQFNQGEDDQPGLKLEDSLSEKTPVLTVRKRHLTEESSDDDIESESPLDEIANAPDFDNSNAESSAIFPPSSLGLREQQAHSSARSDTSGSSAGDLGDVTPCNASPNIPGAISLRPARSEVLDNWNAFVQANNLSTPDNCLQFFHQLQNLITEICNSTIEITKEASVNMLDFIQYTLGTQATIILLTARLNAVIDIINYRISPVNMIWFNTMALSNSRFYEIVKYGMLEVQEHLETFCDKRDQAMMYCDAVKATLKLELLSGQQPDVQHEQYIVDLGRALYKLFFQLILLVEAGNKIIASLHTCLRSGEFIDVSREIAIIRSAIFRASEDMIADGDVSPSSAVGTENLVENLCFLIDNEKWTSVVLFYKYNKGAFLRENEEIFDRNNDVLSIMNFYCSKMVEDRPECFVISNQDLELQGVYTRIYQVSAAVSDLNDNFERRAQNSSKSSVETNK